MRREAARLIAIMLVLAIILPFCDQLAGAEDHRQPLTLASALAFAAELDAANDLLPLWEPPTTLHSHKAVVRWEREIVPYFATEGIADADALVYPDVKFVNYEKPVEIFHLLGTSSLLGGDITLNARYTQRVSTLYANPNGLITLIHELCHAQGIMMPYRGWEQFGIQPYDVETSAQLCALETAAAMVTSGNRAVLASLLYELEDMSLGAAQYLAMRDDQLDVYHEAIAGFLDPWQQARLDRSERYWQQDPKQLQEILQSYYYQPVALILAARAQQQTIAGVQLPINWLADFANHPYAESQYGPGGGGPRAPMSLFPVQPLVIDDLCAVLDHAAELAMTK